MWDVVSKRPRRLVAAGVCLLCLAVDPVLSQPALIRKVKPGLIRHINTFVHGGTNSTVTFGAMAFDDQFAFVATPNGIFRSPLPIGPSTKFTPRGFQGQSLTNLYVHENKLYVLKFGAWAKGQATDHAFLRSEDHGATFVPMDNILQDCAGGWCAFLTPTHALFRDDLIFLNAGGAPNLLVSDSAGASWLPLLGNARAMVCSHQPFELIGDRIIIGGECPLDIAYLRTGTLRPDRRGWTQMPISATTPPLDNRNIHFIRNKPNTGDVYAGAEGALLKSTDSGLSFRYVVQYSSAGGGRYPYLMNILFPSRSPNVIVVGGWDKGMTRSVFLAYSRDNGETWYDISSAAQAFAGPPSQNVEADRIDFLAEDADGRIFAGIRYLDTTTTIVLRLNVDLPTYYAH